MILVVGSSGLLGGEVAKRLLDQGQPVRAMTRTPAKLERLRQLDAEVVRGDLIDPLSLAEACRGAQCVFSAAHSLVGKGRYKSEVVDEAGHRSLIDAAKAAGVSHFVYTSILGAAPDHPVDFWRTKYRVEEYLQASGLTYTILRPSAFMETHAHIFNGKSILERGKTTLLGSGTKPRSFVAVRDVAQIAVHAVTDPKLAGRVLEVGGPEDFTNNEVSELYGRLAGLTPKIRHVPAPIARGASIVLKPFQPGISRVMYLGSLPDDAFSERFDHAALLAEFPIQRTTLEGFVRERIAESGRSSAA